MKYIFTGLLVAFLVLCGMVYYNYLSKEVKFGMAELKIIKQSGEVLTFDIDVADALNERAQGLMFVKEMPQDKGMLFIFEDETVRRMWMENTYIPLDMIFVNGSKTIFNYHKNAQPLSRDIIPSLGPAKYVLEFNAGFVERHNIQLGDKIDFTIKD